MKFSASLLIITAAFFSFSCAKRGQAKKMETVVIVDGYKTAADAEGAEIIIEEKDFGGINGRGLGSAASRQERVLIAADNSRITTMFDGYGNKTEMRFFDNNPLVQSVVIRTSVKGEIKVSIFGQNGTVRDLPPEMHSRVLNASANDLAKTAGITEGRRENAAPTIVQSSQPLQPMPSYKFPVQMPAPQQASSPVEPVEDAAPETADQTEKAPVEAIIQPPPKTGKLASKIPSGDLD